MRVKPVKNPEPAMSKFSDGGGGFMCIISEPIQLVDCLTKYHAYVLGQPSLMNALPELEGECYFAIALLECDAMGTF